MLRINVCLYASSKNWKVKNFKTILFNIETKCIKYLRINIRYVRILY